MSTTMPYYLTNFLAKNEWNIHAQDDYALRWASENGHTEVVNLLIKNQNSEMTIEEFTLKLKLKKN